MKISNSKLFIIGFCISIVGLGVFGVGKAMGGRSNLNDEFGFMFFTRGERAVANERMSTPSIVEDRAVTEAIAESYAYAVTEENNRVTEESSISVPTISVSDTKTSRTDFQDSHMTYLDSIKEIHINIVAGSVILKEGSDFSVITNEVYSYGYSESFNPHNERLTIVSDFDVKYSNRDWKNTKIIVTVPKGQLIEDIKIVNRVGTVDVSDVIGGKMTFELTMNSLTVEDVTATELYVSSNMGKIDIEDIVVNGELELLTQMGDIDFSGTVNGDINVTNNFGNINLDLDNDPTDFTFDFIDPTILTNIKIDDKNATSFKHIDNIGKYNLSISLKAGKADIEF